MIFCLLFLVQTVLGGPSHNIQKHGKLSNKAGFIENQRYMNQAYQTLEDLEQAVKKAAIAGDTQLIINKLLKPRIIKYSVGGPYSPRDLFSLVKAAISFSAKYNNIDTMKAMLSIHRKQIEDEKGFLKTLIRHSYWDDRRNVISALQELYPVQTKSKLDAIELGIAADKNDEQYLRNVYLKDRSKVLASIEEVYPEKTKIKTQSLMLKIAAENGDIQVVTKILGEFRFNVLWKLLQTAVKNAARNGQLKLLQHIFKIYKIEIRGTNHFFDRIIKEAYDRKQLDVLSVIYNDFPDPDLKSKINSIRQKNEEERLNANVADKPQDLSDNVKEDNEKSLSKDDLKISKNVIGSPNHDASTEKLVRKLHYLEEKVSKAAAMGNSLLVHHILDFYNSRRLTEVAVTNAARNSQIDLLKSLLKKYKGKIDDTSIFADAMEAFDLRRFDVYFTIIDSYPDLNYERLNLFQMDHLSGEMTDQVLKNE